MVVRGGWEGHSPVEATDKFIPFLRENGFEVTVSGTTESYLDLDGTDLVLQCVTMSEIPAEHPSSAILGQERLGREIIRSLDGILEAHGVAVYLDAVHLCTQMRGVREVEATTRTNFYRGAYEDDPRLRGEFLALCGIRSAATPIG